MSEDTASIHEVPLPTSDETPGKIQVRRDEVLNAFNNFKYMAKEKREKLTNSKKYQLFKEDAIELENWIKDAIVSLSLEGKTESNLVNIQVKQRRHQTLIAELDVYGRRLTTLCDQGRKLILAKHYASKNIQEHIEKLVDLWEKLRVGATQKTDMLSRALNITTFYRLCDSLLSWINEKEKALQENFSLRDKENFSHGVLEPMIKDIHVKSQKLFVIRAEADRLLKDGVEDEVDVLSRRDSVKEAWDRLMEEVNKLKNAQLEEERVSRLAFELAEIKQFIEQNQAIKTMEPLSSTTAIEEQLRNVDMIVTNLQHFDHRLKHAVKDAKAFGKEKDTQQLTSAFENFKGELANLREAFNSEIQVSKFNGEYADIVSWSREVFATMNVSELPSDVDNAEQLLEMMKDLEGEIEAHAETIDSCLENGKALREYRDLIDKMNDLSTIRDELRTDWGKRNNFFKSCHQLRTWERDAAKLQHSITKIHDLLTRLLPVNNSSLHNAEKQCAELEHIVAADEKLLDGLAKKVEAVVGELPDMTEVVNNQMETLKNDFQNLKDLRDNVQREIQATNLVQGFERELESINNWIISSRDARERPLRIDKKNIRAEERKHSAFKNELKIYGSRLDDIGKKAEDLRNNGYIHAYNLFVKTMERWSELNIESEDRSEFLEAVNIAVQVECEIKEFNEWLVKAEGQIRSVNESAMGENDPSTIKAKLKSLKLLEVSSATHQEMIDDIGNRVENLENKETIAKYSSILQRYGQLNKDLSRVLEVSNQQHQDLDLLSEVYDELNWAREKLRITVLLDSEDLHLLRIALQKNEMLLAEIDDHIKIIEELEKRLDTTNNQEENRLPKLVMALRTLTECFSELVLNANLKQKYLTMMIEKNKYCDDVREAQEWVDSKDRLFLRSAELKDEESSERASRQHDAFLLDIQAFKPTIDELHFKVLELQKKSVNDFPHILCQQNYVARGENEISVKKGERALLLDQPTTEHWKIQSNGAIGIVPKSNFRKIEPNGQLRANERQNSLERAYENLTKKAEQRKSYIKKVNSAYHLNRELMAIVVWVDDKIAALRSQKSDSLSRISSFEKDLQDYKGNYEQKLQQLSAQANASSNDSSIQAIFRHTLDNLRTKWKLLGDLFATKEQKAAACMSLDKWLHNAAELEGYISEKELLISGEIIACDNGLITKVKRDYEVAESDMEDMGRMLDVFMDSAEALRQRFPEISSSVYNKQKEIYDRWNGLLNKLEERRNEIRELVPLYAFLSENQDLLQWIESETAVASSTDLANDIEGIKAMLDQHSELWDDISARKRDLIELERNGGGLIAACHLARNEIAIQLNKVIAAFNALQVAWNKRNDLLEDALESLKFLREYEQFDGWLTTHEAMIVSHDVSGENVDTLYSRQEELKKFIDKKRDAFNGFNLMADNLLSKKNVDKEAVEDRRAHIRGRWEQLTLDLYDSISRISDERTIQNFAKQADDVELWIREKFMILEEIEYLPEKELDAAGQKHTTLGEEIKAMNDRIAEVLSTGQEAMNKSCKSMDQTDLIMERIQRVQVEWERLSKSYSTIFTTLQKERNRKKFKRLANDLEHWIGVMEAEFSNKDCGSDIDALNQHLKKIDFFEVEISVYGDKVLEMVGLLEELPKEAVDESLSFEEVDAETMRTRAAAIVERFDRLRALADSRINLLNNTLKAYRLAQKADDEISWASEKRILSMNEDYGRNFSHFESVLRKHRRLEEDVMNRQRQVVALKNECSEVQESISKSIKIDTKLCDLDALWADLKNELVNRNRHLAECRKYHELSSQIEEENYWFAECAEILDQSLEARSSVAVECALKKHNILEDELEIHQSHVMDIMKKNNFAENSQFYELLQKELSQLQKRLTAVISLSTSRRDVLEEAANAINFHWQCDFIEAWIADQMRLLNFVENVEDLERIRGLKSQHTIFCAKVKAFQQDELEKCANYVKQIKQTAANERMYAHWAEVLKKWNILEVKTLNVGKQLDQAEVMRSDLEKLWLEFAQLASAFNSYYENSAEDLTDPIRWCSSRKDLEEMWKTHSTFVSSLSTAELKYKSLIDLDAEARKIYPGPNPFTWFDIQAIETTWKSLQQFVQQRKVALEQVAECLMENERIEKEFAAQANLIADWIAETKRRALKADGSLEDQLNKMHTIISELIEKRVYLKKIDELGAGLERRLLFTNQYTNYSRISLYHDWNNLEQLVTRLRQSIEQQIRALKDGDVKEDTLKEYMTIFRHYDKNLSGYVDYIDCLKCLSALGIDVGEVYEGAASKEQQLLLKQLDPQNEGKISIQSFISWMISQETPDVRHGDDIRAAFRALTKDGKPYVTQDDLKTVLSPKELTYCIQHMPRYRDQNTGNVAYEIFDYHQFAEQITHD